MSTVDRDSLRIIFRYLFTLKKDKREGDGFFFQGLPSVPLDNPECPPHIIERWSAEREALDVSESLDWKNMRSVSREWKELADEEFDLGGHNTPFRFAVMKERKESLELLMRMDDYFFPALILVSCEHPLLIDMRDLFQRKPALFDEFINSLLFTEENTGMHRANGYIITGTTILSNQSGMEIVLNDERVTDEQLQSIVMASCWFKTPDFFRGAMKNPRVRTEGLGLHLNRSCWADGIKIYIEEGGNQGAFIDILSSGQEDVTEEILFLAIDLVEQNLKLVLVMLAVTMGDSRLVDLSLNHAKLTEDQLETIIYHSCGLLQEDAEGNGLKVLLKRADHVPITALDSAIGCGSMNKLRILINDPRVDCTEGVYLASIVGNIEMMKEFISSGRANLRAVSTALKKAFITNEPEEHIEVLFNAYNLDDNVSQAIPAMFFAPVKYMERLINKLQEFKPQEKEDWINYTLVLSPFRDDPSLCEYMLAHVSKPDILSLTMISACFSRKLNYVKLLMEKATIDLSFRNYSCVRLANDIGCDDIYQYLLEKGGKLDPIIHPLYYPRKRFLLHMDIQVESERRAYLSDPLLNRAFVQYTNDRAAALTNFGPNLLSRLIGSAAYADNMPMMKNLLADPSLDPSVDDQDSFFLCAKLGKVEPLKLILNDPRTDPAAKDGEALRLAVESGNSEAVNLLLATGRSNLANSNALIVACDGGIYDIASTLLARKEIDLRLWGVPSFISLVSSGNPQAKKLAEGMFEEVKEGLALYDKTLPSTFKQICDELSPKKPWFESKWVLPLEFAVIAGFFVAVSFFSSKRNQS